MSYLLQKTRPFGQFPGTRDSREKGVPGTGIPGSKPAGHIRTLMRDKLVKIEGTGRKKNSEISDISTWLELSNPWF